MTPDSRSIRPKGLTHRLAILFGLLVLLLLGVAAAYIDFSWHAVKRERLADLRNLVELGAASSELFLQRYSERAAILAEDVALHGGAENRTAVRARLLRYQAADPNLAGIYAFLPDGTSAWPAPPMSPRRHPRMPKMQYSVGISPKHWPTTAR